MIDTIKNEKGYVISYIEFNIFNKFKFQVDDGEWAYIASLWTHPDVERRGIINYYVQKNFPKYPSVKWVYWLRGKYGDRMSVCEVIRGKRIELRRINYGSNRKTQCA